MLACIGHQSLAGPALQPLQVCSQLDHKGKLGSGFPLKARGAQVPRTEQLTRQQTSVQRRRRTVGVRAEAGEEKRTFTPVVQTETQGSVLVVTSDVEVSPASDAKADRAKEDSHAEEDHGKGQREGKDHKEGTLEEELRSLKVSLLAAVAGLDRGVAAGPDERRAVENAALDLEAAGPRLQLLTDLDKIEGKWRLLYTSSFSSGSLGGSRPGPPFGRLPFKLGQVYQRINNRERKLDNIVELMGSAPWPLPGLQFVLTLEHAFQVTGDNEIEITATETKVQAKGFLGDAPELMMPSLPEFLRPPSSLRSSRFNTTYVDDEVRITRGDRGELRVFSKAGFTY